MRVVFFGTPDFAVPTLQCLLDRPEFEVVGVVSQPDRPQGRGQKLLPTPVKAVAVEAEIPLWQPDRLRKSPEAIAELTSLQADFFVVVAYGQILAASVLSIPRLACVNVHGSLLPAYRGAAPIQWAIASGETETGITTMLMDVGMDTGDMLLKATVPILPHQTAPELAETLAPLGAQLLVETLLKLNRSELTSIPQDPALATYAPLLTKDHFQLDWTLPASDLHNRIRGFYPHCFTTWRGERLKILGSTVEASNSDPTEPGQIVGVVKGQGFRVATGSGALLVNVVQLAGKKQQSGWDFVNGVRLTPGDTVR